ncbi:MAG TPA: ABC transporter substrate-binding protein, partial [Ktedonobacteraceae bacterium]|nr:ABC transporter substrate-binding protein [Ktedonobacteraceae bacterium]
FASHPDTKVLLDAAPYGHADNYGAKDTFIHQRLDLAIGNVLQGQTTAQSALDTAAKQVDNVLAT